jgi:hypothetical protein
MHIPNNDQAKGKEPVLYDTELTCCVCGIPLYILLRDVERVLAAFEKGNPIAFRCPCGSVTLARTPKPLLH